LQHIFRHPVDVKSRLHRLGLTEELLLEAIGQGLSAWRECTENDPPSFSGIAYWAAVVRSLRESLMLDGWERLNDRNLPLTVCVATNIALTASSGDDCTGIEDLSPRTRNPKGLTTQQKVKTNAEQLGLFSDMSLSAEELVAEVVKWDTWLLLSYKDHKSGNVRCELSRPVNIGTDGRVDGWYERIILDEVPFDGDQVRLTRGKGNGGSDADGSSEFADGSDPIDIEVKRRA
jgi:hypothetical protein